MQRTKLIWHRVSIVAMILGIAACTSEQPRTEGQSNSVAPLAAGEFGRAVDEGQPAKNIQTFDTLDFDVFSNQKWDRLGESHADDIIATWPDGHDTRGIATHIEDLKKLFVHAPDTAIKVHPIRIANGDRTAVTGVMTGTFSRPMPMADGSVVQPTGKKFSLPMATVAQWRDGKMVHEWLFWDNATYMAQLGINQ